MSTSGKTLKNTLILRVLKVVTTLRKVCLCPGIKNGVFELGDKHTLRTRLDPHPFLPHRLHFHSRNFPAAWGVVEGKSVIAAKRPGTVGVLVSGDEGGRGRRGVVTQGDQVVADQVLVGVKTFEYGPPAVDDFLRGEQFRFAVVEGDLVAEDVG